MNRDDLQEKLDQAELVLVGIGEEFDAACLLREKDNFKQGREILRGANAGWLVPAWAEYCCAMEKIDLRPVLKKLADMLEGKNYFCVSVSVNSAVSDVFGDSARLVTPCGTVKKTQCSGGCGREVMSLTNRESGFLKQIFDMLWETKALPEDQGDYLNQFGSCEKCGSPLTLNHIYSDKYDEQGYMEDWKRYTRWLQGTLNHRLLMLELGVSMGFPSVIRKPYEKIASYHQTSFLVRVNEKLWQIPQQLSSKAVGIEKNGIDWLSQL